MVGESTGKALLFGGVVPNTSLLRRLAPTRGLEPMMSCGVTRFTFFLAPLSLKLEGLLKYLWLDSIGIGWQKRGEQSKIKSEECDRDYSESDPTPRRRSRAYNDVVDTAISTNILRTW